MPSILEISEVRQCVSRLSVEEFHRMDQRNQTGRRRELIRGIVIEKSAKSIQHHCVAKRLHERIAAQLPESYVLRREEPLTFADSEPVPDIAIVCGGESDFFDAHARTTKLIIEVADSYSAFDQQIGSIYAESDVKAYWIVRCLERQADIYTVPERGVFREMHLISRDGALKLSDPHISIQLAQIFPTGVQ